MKTFSLLFLSIPFHVFAQYNSNSPENLSSASVKENKIKSVTTTTLITRFSHIGSQRDSTKFDTAIVEIKKYEINGNTVSGVYSSNLDDAHYEKKSFYTNGKLVRQITYENGVVTDSIVVLSDSPNYKDCWYGNGYRVIYERQGDTLLIEKNIKGNDTIIHTHKIKAEILPENKSHWDEEFKGDYSKKIIHHDAIHNSDTCIFYDEKGEIILTLVDHYDNMGRVICSDYYNRTDKNLRIYQARFNSKNNMVTFMPTNKKGKLTYQIKQTYNSNGLLSEVKHIPVKKTMGITDIKYEYEYFK